MERIALAPTVVVLDVLLVEQIAYGGGVQMLNIGKAEPKKYVIPEDVRLIAQIM
jgi:hypothetical protein